MRIDDAAFHIGVDDAGKIVVCVEYGEGKDIRIHIPHEIAVQVAEAIYLKAAYVEFRIQESVDRMTEGGQS